MTEEEFNKLLDEYRSNQLQFLTTQRPEYQKAAKIAQSALEDALTDKQASVDQQRRDMAHYIGSHAEGTKELFTLVEKADDMRGNAQKLIDSYDTSKSRYDAWSANPVSGSSVNYENGYAILWRTGVVMLLFIVLMVVGVYTPRPSYTNAASWLGYGAPTPMSPMPSNYLTPGSSR